MKKLWFGFNLILILTSIASGQETEKILEEGKLLYRLELKKENLVIITQKAWDKINKQQDKKNK